ncbi:MAG TPA: sulfite exporter TauE/SafE family protein [Nitrososphaerales archaeon]|nr:sulfite exporter TauE/SafE family protein [Nitrososphaerales archaeon]
MIFGEIKKMIVIPYLLVVLGIFVLGVITGGLSNVTSGGAGVLTIYVLVNFASIQLQNATGTVLAASAVFVLIGVITFFRRGQVDTQLGITVGLSGVAGAFFAARWASTIQSASLEHIFGAFTLALAVFTSYLFISDWRKSKAIKEGRSVSGLTPTSNVKLPVQLQMQQPISRFSGTSPMALSVQIVKGVLIGIATGLFGVGLASLSVVLFLLLFKLDTKMVLGTSLFASFFRYAGGSLGYLSTGQIDPFWFLILVVGGGIGSVIGARMVLGNGIASRDIVIKLIQVAILLFISYEFLIKYLIFGS